MDVKTETRRFAFPKGDEGVIWASMEVPTLPPVPAEAAAQQKPAEVPAEKTLAQDKVFEFERGDGFKFRMRRENL